MGCRGDDVGIFERVVEQTCGDEAGGVGHVDHEDGADAVGDFTHAGIVPFAAVGAGAADDEFRALAQGYFLHLVVVDEAVLFAHVILEGVEDETREVDRAAVREVTAV